MDDYDAERFVSAAEYFAALHLEGDHDSLLRRHGGGEDAVGAGPARAHHWVVIFLGLVFIGVSSAISAYRLYGELLLY